MVQKHNLIALYLCLSTACGPFSGSVDAASFHGSADSNLDGGKSKCPIKGDKLPPLVVDWSDADRAVLEAAAKRGTVVVQYKNCQMEILPRCHAPGAYQFRPHSPANSHIAIHDEDELYASLLVGAARLEGRLRAAGQLDLRMTTVGEFHSDQPNTYTQFLQGECSNATHFVASTTVGAFQFTAATETAKGGGAIVMGQGATGERTHSREVLNSDGDEASCRRSSPTDKAPPNKCGAVMGVELKRLSRAGMPPVLSSKGDTVCALTSAGVLHCFMKTLLDGKDVLEHTRVPVMTESGLPSVPTAVSTGGTLNTCILTSTQGVACKGFNNFGQLGRGTTPGRQDSFQGDDSFQHVLGLEYGAIAVSTGQDFSCVVTSSGGVLCFGRGDRGQLGNGATTDMNRPTKVSRLTSGAVAVSVGEDHACAVTATGAVFCWGSNDYGQLGDGTTRDRNVPVQVSGLASGVIAVSAGDRYTCAVTSAGAVLCWGDNWSGRLGDGTTDRKCSVPTAVSGLSSGAIGVSTGSSHTCAVTSSGAALCWGRNSHGQLGDATVVDRPVPTQVSGLRSGIVAISTGLRHTCALTSTDQLLCWGDLANGNGNVPVSVPDFK